MTTLLGAVRARFAEVAAVAPPAYWYVWWGSLINRLGTFVVPLLTLYLTRVRHLGLVEASALVSWYGVGQIGASLLGGQLADRLGRRATMLLSLFGGAVAIVALGQARDLAWIGALVGAVGFVGDLYRPAVAAFVADVVPPARRLEAYGLLYWAVNVGFAGGSLLGGLLFDLDPRIIFYADAATVAAFGLFVLLRVPESRPPRPAAPAGATPAPAPAGALRDGPFLTFLAISFAVVLLPLTSLVALPVQLAAQGHGATAYGAVTAVNGALIIALQPAVTAWAARRGVTPVLAGSAVLYGVGMFGHGLATSLAGHVAAVGVWTLAEILEAPVRAEVVARMAPPDHRGRYQGAMALVWGAGQVVSVRAGGWLYARGSPMTLWTGCLVLGLAAGAAYAATGAARARRMAGD